MTAQDSERQVGGTFSRERKRRYRLYGKAYYHTKMAYWLAQGRQCFYRFKNCLNTPDVIAHKDHSPENWDPENLATSCRHCNAVISNQAKGKPRSVETRVREIEPGPADSLIPVSQRMQDDLENWMMERLGPAGPHLYLPVVHIEKEAGFDCSISPITIHRYLVKPGPLTASNARWRLVELNLPGDRPGKKTKCIMWAGHKLEEILQDQLYRTGRQQFEKSLN